MNDYERVAQVIRYLDEHYAEQPELSQLAGHLGLSLSHFHRLFSAWAGVTPKDFLQCLTLAHARELLRNGHSVLDAALAAGLSGPGRLHDLCVSLEAASPGELKSGGEGWEIVFGCAATPFGNCLIAQGPRGICHLAFADGEEQFWDAEQALRQTWSKATCRRSDDIAREVASGVFRLGSAPHGERQLRAFVCGSAFQVRVWRALLSVPAGSVITYRRLADAIGQPAAARAVGSAVGRNALAYLIPCHRVIRETGVTGDYRWGAVRKRAMLAWETARAGSV